MVRLLFRTIGALLLAGFCLLAWRHFFPNDPAQIRDMLERLAQSACVPAKPSAVAAALASDRVRNSFSTNIEVVMDAPGSRRSVFNDREDLVQACQAAWAGVPGLTVEFCDINIPVCGEDIAKAEMTVRASRPGEKYFFLQSFKLDLRKENEIWRIAKIAPYDVFH